MTNFKPWISIPNSFLIWWISISTKSKRLIKNEFGILIHSLELAILQKAPFCRLVERVPTNFFFRWCQILSRTIWVDSLTLLFPISKIHSKQNFHQRPDHCDRTPCIYTVQMHKQCFKTFFALWFSHQLNVLRTFFAQSYFLNNLIGIWS